MAQSQSEWSREDFETNVAYWVRWVLIVFFAVVTIFPFYWMVNLSMRTAADVQTNPTKLYPSMEDIRTTMHPVGCWLRFGTDELEENPNLPENC
ncbi:MAG: hypothetical protein AAF126_19210, partial [Chloroflexota bacterium]